jgi:hypothetical protein
VIRKRVCAVLAASYALLFVVGCGGGYSDTCDTDADCNDGLECLKNCGSDGNGGCVCSEISVCTRSCDDDDDCVDNDTGTVCHSCNGHSNCAK